LLADDLNAIPESDAKREGLRVGHLAAQVILAFRFGDGSDSAVEYVFSDEPGAWRPDPINPDQQPLGEEWYLVEPFVMAQAEQFRAPPPPSIESEEYAVAYNEVKALGGDGEVTPTIRTEEQTQIGIFWA
jgi:hypothetical protein